MSDLSDLLKTAGASIEAEDDFDAINALYLERGWGDGLPIVPPTAQRVERMLAWCDRPIDEPIAKMAPRYGDATPLRLGANAVMAGCRPEYFPIYMLAIEAMCEESFNLYGVQATTHLCAPLVIVNGPVGGSSVADKVLTLLRSTASPSIPGLGASLVQAGAATAAVTLNFSLNASTKSASSMTVMLPMVSSSSSLFAILLLSCTWSCPA